MHLLLVSEIPYGKRLRVFPPAALVLAIHAVSLSVHRTAFHLLNSHRLPILRHSGLGGIGARTWNQAST